MVSLSLSCAVWPGLKLWSTDDEFMFALVWTIWLTLNRVKFYKIPRELIRLSSILILSVGTTFIQILVYTGFRSTFNHVWSRFKTLIGRRWEWTKVVELVNLRVGEFCSFVCLSTSAATLSYQFHLPRTYFSPTGIFRLRISTDINLRRVNKIKFLFGSILVPVFFRVSDLKPVFIYPSECEFRTGFRSRRDFRPTFPHLFRQENRSKIFRRDTRLSMLIYLAFTLVVNGWKLK